MHDLICPHCHRMSSPGAPMDLVAFQRMQPESSVEVELGSALSSDGTPTINSCWAHFYRATDEWSNGDGTYRFIGSPLELMPDLICTHCYLPNPGAPMDLVAFQPMQPKLSSIPESSVEVESVEVELGSTSSSDDTPTINSCWAHSYRWHLLASYHWHLSCHVTVIN